MPYINPESLRRDEIVAEAIDWKGDISQYLSEIDDEITLTCAENGVVTGDIPVDVDGYVTSIVLRMFGIYYGMYAILRGFNRSGNGEGDDAYNKMNAYYDRALDIRQKITKDTILGGDGSEPVAPESFVEQSFMVV